MYQANKHTEAEDERVTDLAEGQSPAHMLSNMPRARLKVFAAEGSTRQDLKDTGVRGAACLVEIGLPG